MSQTWCKTCLTNYPAPHGIECPECNNFYCGVCIAYALGNNKGTNCVVCSGYRCEEHDTDTLCPVCNTDGICGICKQCENCYKNKTN